MEKSQGIRACLSFSGLTWHCCFRYRCWFDGSTLRLVITDRLYVAQGVTLAGGIVTTAQIADF